MPTIADGQRAESHRPYTTFCNHLLIGQHSGAALLGKSNPFARVMVRKSRKDMEVVRINTQGDHFYVMPE